MNTTNVNLIPMAGLGSRFSNDGYRLPKPLIEVSGQPMIIQVIRSLPPAKRHIFIVRQEHITDYQIDQVIKKELPEAEIVSLQETTDGQATTCLLGLANVADDEDVFIASCDNSFLYNQTNYHELRLKKDVDAIFWTFTDNDLLEAKPESWGWCRLDVDGQTITDMSVKIPVSDNPRHDHAIVASFYFKRAGDFRVAYEAMRMADHRINGEFYVDAMPIFLKQIGKRSVIFDIDLYVGWGKPTDLYLYQYYEHLYKYNPDKLDAKWRKFFNKT